MAHGIARADLDACDVPIAPNATYIKWAALRRGVEHCQHSAATMSTGACKMSCMGVLPPGCCAAWPTPCRPPPLQHLEKRQAPGGAAGQ